MLRGKPGDTFQHDAALASSRSPVMSKSSSPAPRRRAYSMFMF